ncbi:PREDICTED: TMV resistance protein N-like isoform X1 [Fragaria vesca subsp. vesca]|nr:PREDICTED: TMV resistance protein N-like isoform X1 [Fragaria vesca subsp. vesca]XP_011458817.1 PREDICTED: TMV resistance protein N-like isoform X1 [Fragaria vesca subsp. vesca]XP_011458818.1 PREDICTED: TMV resistance protein N-like isoform X1 [Fragaria vesca subsp. vesca]XP_011458819.1 PREDICTED: TMV resistance protein N-like isoform X1 [Fragaria vesca subsp. vesca]
MASASSLSVAAHVLPHDKYDVFLSFRGIDTRLKFTTYLYDALKRRKIDTYIDDQLERGEEIELALLEAIEQSRISIIVFSKNYASSRWCLDELVHILKCKQKYGRIVIPVFYEIDPSHVRKQEESYADAFVSHEKEKRFKDKVLIWRDALSTAANLSGFDSQNVRTEAELVEKIVNDILGKLMRISSTSVRGLIGFESQIQQIESLLCIDAEDVEFRLVGIWGMGGIGKTTLADAVYHRHSSKFDTCTFLSNVREESEKRGILDLRNELFRKLLMDKSLSIDTPSIGLFVLNRLSRTKVLVVLDDVNESEQLDYLLGQQVVFGCGSRVIITSRDRRPLIERVDDDLIYKVIKLNDVDALKLFQLKAFRDGASKIDNSELLEEVVSYAEGIPLVLKILGSLFRNCNNEKDCKDKLKILKRFPDKKIQDVLRVSYNGLQEHERQIFLDIACFFKGENKYDVERLIEMHGFCAPLQGISVLIDMSLISISVNDCLEMHDLLQEMGMSIVREQCTFDPGRRSRLWSVDDSYQVLKYNTGTARVEVMFVNISRIQGLQLSRTTFKNMHNLRLLKFHAPFKHSQEDVDEANKVYLPQGLESLPEGLRYLYWDGYRFKSLPSEFLPRNLVELRMSYSLIEKLWSNGKNLGSLKVIDLSYSKELCEVPDLSESPNIEEIDFSWCISLAEVPSYFENLKKLTSLNLSGCENLETFPNEMPCNLRFLNLSYCEYLTKVPDLSRCANIENIDLSATNLVEIPSYFQHLDKLTSLNLAFCMMLEYLPELPCNVEYLNLDFCGSLNKLHNSIYKLNCLANLSLGFCSTLEKLPPFSVGLCSLKEFNIGGCDRLQIPDDLICLSSLHILNLEDSMIESIPVSINNVSGLRILKLSECKKLQSLPELPALLETLEADGCTSLQQVASSRTSAHQFEDPCYREELLNFIDCIDLNDNSRSNIMDDARSSIMKMASSKVDKTIHPDRLSTEDSVTVIYPGNAIPEWFSYRAEGCSVEIEFSPDWFHNADFLGFALCAVVASEFELTCQCNYKTHNGEGYGYSSIIPNTVLRGARTNSDHVLWSFTGAKHSSAGASLVPFTKVAKASFHFYASGFIKGILKACGIRLLYAHDSGSGPGKPNRDVNTGGTSSGLADQTVDENNATVLPDVPLQEVEQPSKKLKRQAGASTQKPKRKTQAPPYLKDFVPK